MGTTLPQIRKGRNEKNLERFWQSGTMNWSRGCWTRIHIPLREEQPILSMEMAKGMRNVNVPASLMRTKCDSHFFATPWTAPDLLLRPCSLCGFCRAVFLQQLSNTAFRAKGPFPDGRSLCNFFAPEVARA
jgi:hypothetical protein